MPILSFLLSLLTGAGGIASTIQKLYAEKLTAANDAEKLAIQERISDLQTQASAQKPFDAIIRGAFAIPVAIYYGKLLLIDKVFGFFFHTATDPLSGPLVTYTAIVVGFYFLHQMKDA